MEDCMTSKRWTLGIIALIVFLGVTGGSLWAFDFSTIENKITDFTLDNGLKFIVLEDHSAPVASFVTLVDVGGADDPRGYDGLAHVFEHMAFKGTDEVGTKDYKAEMKALEKLDAAYAAYREEEKKGTLADANLLADLKADFDSSQQAADQLVEMNEYSVIVDREGGVGLNAGTGYDQTMYYCSFPSNRTELWFALESGRFLRPVLRQFYKEKDVIKEERRMGVESSPVGRLVEEFLGLAFKAHPYGMSLIGPMSDLSNIDKQAARDFLAKYYVASNMMIAIVGDVKPDDVKKLAKEYFGPLPKRPEPDRVTTIEPAQDAERRVAVFDKSQPFLLIGYHRPAVTDQDDPVYDAIADYLGQGRTSLLYSDLVKDKKIATSASAFASFPGNKYASEFGIFVVPAQGVTAEDCEAAVYEDIEKVVNEPIPQAELDKIKARAKASFINQLSSRSGMASQLVMYQNFFGDWRQMFKSLDAINAVTAEDVQRVAKETLARSNRTVGYIETTDEEGEKETK
jgi:predicted Zn-dependent peptidase